MSLLDAIRGGMAELASVEAVEDGVCVTTHCLYPSNEFVRVWVGGRLEECRVSDRGRAVLEAETAGIVISNPDRRLRHLMKDQGLRISRGVIWSPPVPMTAVHVAIAIVANASKDAADWMYEHMRIPRERDFKLLVRNALHREFDDSVHHDESIVGSSNKTHKFENVVRLPGGRRMIFDPVTHEPSSINSRVVANLDVRNAEHPNLVQRIVYDDAERWSPSDLNLLQVGAQVVRFSQASEVIKRIAASA